MPTTHIIHHNDPDGWCSAAIVYQALFKLGCYYEFHEMNYGKLFSWDRIKNDDVVYMVDFSFQMLDMIQLENFLCDFAFTWIDHHVSAIKDADAAKFSPTGKREIGKAACELCWDYFHPVHEMPENIRLIGRYDVWDKSAWPNALYAMYAVKSLPRFNFPSSNTWFDIISGKIDLVKIGEPIARYQEGVNIEIVKRTVFDTSLTGWNGLRSIACNSPLCNSMLFDSVWDPVKHDIMLSFYLAGNGLYTVSIYSTKPDVDCSAIAKHFGGGGHKGAAGFQCKELPFAHPARI